MPPNDFEGQPIPGAKSIVDLSVEAQQVTRFKLMYEFS